MKNQFTKVLCAILILGAMGAYPISVSAQWTAANTGLPTGGTGANGFISMVESSTSLYIGSGDGYVYSNDFSTGLGKSWTAVPRPVGAFQPLTNMCTSLGYLYVAWGNNIYVTGNNGLTWTTLSLPFAFDATSPSYYLIFNNQSFAADGTYFYYMAQNTGQIYRSVLGTSTVTLLNTIPTGRINAMYLYGGKIYAGTTDGLFATSASTVGAAWSDEFASTPYAGSEVFQFINTQFSTSVTSGTFSQCSNYIVPRSFTYYPFSMVVDKCPGTMPHCPQVIQQVQTVAAVHTGPGGRDCPVCTFPIACWMYTWTSTYSYTDNGRTFPFSTNSSHFNFVAAAGGFPSASPSPAKIWGLSTAGSGVEQGTLVNGSTWAAGTGGVSGLPTPSPFSTNMLMTALGSHNTYGGFVQGLVFITLNNPVNSGKVYGMLVTSAKTSDDQGTDAIAEPGDVLDNALEVFPNPATNRVTFDLSMVQAGDFTLKLYDQLGKEIVIPASDSHMDIGDLKLDVDLSKFATGIYLYKLNAGDKTYSGKFVKE